MQQIIFTAIVAIVIFSFLWDTFLDYLNSTRWKLPLPTVLADIIDNEKYKRSIEYQKASYGVNIISMVISLLFMLSLLYFDAFQWIFYIGKGLFLNVVVQNLFIIGVFFFVQSIISIPFSYYSTFVIESKFGFNKSTKRLFFLDLLKGLGLSILIGAPLLSLIIWFYTLFPTNFWIIAWVVVASFSLFITFFYTTLIVPIFNKLSPLPEGELKDAIQRFATSSNIELDTIYLIDGSKRSAKANAYFSGFGKKKKIVLYDTLLNQLSVDEVVAVLSHEIGHYKKKHVIKGLVFGLINTGLLLYIFSLFVGNQLFVNAVGVNETSFAIGLIIFSILFEPVSAVIGLFQTILSRKNEYEADDFAKSYGCGPDLISGLKKLHEENLSNMNPHPWVVFFEYSHPPLIQRINNLMKK